MDLTDCGRKFQAIADLCLKDSFPTSEFGLSRVSFMLSLILRRRGTLGFAVLQYWTKPALTFEKKIQRNLTNIRISGFGILLIVVKVLNALRYCGIWRLFLRYCGICNCFAVMRCSEPPNVPLA